MATRQIAIEIMNCPILRSMPQRRGAVLATVMLLGCSGAEQVVVLYPELGSARSAIVVVADADGARGFAADLDGSAIHLERARSPLDAQLELLLFDDPLATLGVPPGVFGAITDGTGYQLPSATRSFGAQIVAGVANAWAPQTALGSVASNFRTTFQPTPRCRALRVRTATIRPLSLDYAVPLDPEGEAVLIGIQRQMWILRGETMETVEIAGLPDFEPRAAGRTQILGLFFGGEDGRIAFGALDGRRLVLEVASSTRAAPGVRYIDGGIVAEGAEFYTLSTDGSVSRVLPTVAMIQRYFEPLASNAELGGVVRFRGATAAIGAASTEGVVLTDRRTPLSTLGAGVTALVTVPGFGTLAGTTDGQLLIGGNQSYDPLGDTGLVLPLTGIGAFRDTGLLFGGVSGRLGYFSPETGFCLDEELSVLSVARWIIPRPRYGDWLVTGNKVESTFARIAFVTVD